jgi:hypothetical protein
MKIAAVIAKILAALATVVGAIYLLATYGEQIVAWCKKVMASLPEISFENADEEPEAEAEVAEAPVETPVVEEEVIEEVVVEEVPVVEAPAADEVVADEADFVQE